MSMCKMRSLALFCAVAVAFTASAYLVPVEERCGVRVEIGSFPQKTDRPGKNPYAWPLGVTEVEAGAPRTFPVTLENRTGMPIAGELEKGAAAPTWSQTGNVLKIACDAKSFAYRIRLRDV